MSLESRGSPQRRERLSLINSLLIATIGTQGHRDQGHSLTWDYSVDLVDYVDYF